jgi:PAS domain S-box-containing protein
MKKLLIVFFIFFAANLSSQSLHIKNYTIDDGLPSTQTWCSLQDSKGYVWFGTSNGLVKYNGKEFFTYKVSDGLVSSVVLSLLEYKDDIWIATDNGISRYNGKDFTNYISYKGNNFGIVWCITRFKGYIWFGTKKQGLFKFNPAKTDGANSGFVNYSEKDGLPTTSIFSLASDKNYLWIANAHLGLYRYDGKHITNYTKDFNLESKVLTNLIVADSALWVGTKKSGIFKYTYKNSKFIKSTNYFPTDYIYSSAAKGSNLFFGTRGNGLIYYKNKPVRYTSINGLINNLIYSILIDRENSIWVTTNKGISKIISHKFRGYLNGKAVLSICEYKGTIWVGTFENGLIKIEDEKATICNQKNGLLRFKQVWALSVFNGKLWIGSIQGLNSFDGKIFKQYGKMDGIPEEPVLSLFPAEDSLWIGTVNNISNYKPSRPKNKFLTYSSNDGLTNTYFQTICKDGDKVWFGSPGGAFCYNFKGEGKFKKFSQKDGLSSNCINKIFLDSNKILWFGTPNGLNKYEPGKKIEFKIFKVKDGLSDNNITSITQTGNNLWLWTINGLNKFDGEKIVKIYRQKDGLIGNEASSSNSIFPDSNDHIWIGTTMGLTKYIPENDIPNKVSPPVYIEKFFIDDSMISNWQDLEFEYGKNTARFFYTGLSFKDEDDVCYKYKLGGYDRKWSDVTKKTEVRYTNLNNGNYTFKVIAKNGDGYWSENPAEISFIILPPFWKTWWFILIILILTIIVIYALFLLKTSQIRHRAELLEQKVKKRTKELQDSEEKFRTMIEHSNDMIWTLDEKGNFLYVNRKSEEITGYILEKESDKSFVPLIIPEDLKKVKKVFMETLGGKSKHYEVRIYDQNMNVLFLSVNTAPILKNGKIVGTISFGRDITEQKRIQEDQLKSSKLESIGILAGGIAHDFNNILTSVIGNISLAKLYSKPEDRVFRALEKAEKSSMQAQNLTLQLLTFARGGTPIKKTIHTGDLIKSFTILALRGSNVKYEFAIPNDLFPVEADEGQLGQAINNLIINADQSMPGGGLVKVVAENINTDGFFPLKKGKYVKLLIEDNGNGIPEKDLQKIFDPYFTTKTKGSGLGLAITYSIIKSHNGYITVDSEVGIGTKFTIYLPVSEKEAMVKVENNMKEELIKGKGKILMMDDEKVVRDVSGEALEYMGYTVEYAEEGEKAIELYKEAEKTGQPFDAVILDLTVPGGMGGEETIKKLFEINSEVKVIVSSGYSDSPIMSNFREYGFSGVISKPYKIYELSEILNRIIKKAEK